MATDAYRRFAAVYDTLVEPAARSLRKLGLEAYPPRDNLVILDVGCGTGANWRFIAARAADCAGSTAADHPAPFVALLTVSWTPMAICAIPNQARNAPNREAG
jgi:hypothetical protein